MGIRERLPCDISSRLGTRCIPCGVIVNQASLTGSHALSLRSCRTLEFPAYPCVHSELHAAVLKFSSLYVVVLLLTTPADSHVDNRGIASPAFTALLIFRASQYPQFSMYGVYRLFYMLPQVVYLTRKQYAVCTSFETCSCRFESRLSPAMDVTALPSAPSGSTVPQSKPSSVAHESPLGSHPLALHTS